MTDLADVFIFLGIAQSHPARSLPLLFTIHPPSVKYPPQGSFIAKLLVLFIMKTALCDPVTAC